MATRLPGWLSACLFVCVLVCLCLLYIFGLAPFQVACMFVGVRLSTCLSVCLSACLCMSVCLSGVLVLVGRLRIACALAFLVCRFCFFFLGSLRASPPCVDWPWVRVGSSFVCACWLRLGALALLVCQLRSHAFALNAFLHASLSLVVCVCVR